MRSGVSGKTYGEILTAAAVEGAGIVMQPDFVLGPHFANGPLVAVLPEWRCRELTVHAVHHQSRYVSAKVRAFIDFLRESWRDPPWKIKGRVQG